MRNPDRLNKHYDKLKELHMKYCPDWRLGQLLYNLFTWHFEHYGDPFFPEDARFMERVKEYFEETFGN